MKIYTKTGDKGTTRLVDGSCVEKHNPRVEAYGCLDELNSCIGFTLVAIENKNAPNMPFPEIIADLLRIQSELFDIGSLLACEDQALLSKLGLIEESSIEFLEKRIDFYSESLPELRNFILPGGTEISARLHLSRTLCRRAERRTSEILVAHRQYENCLIYLNRLSDLLFVLARFVNFRLNITETLWKKVRSK